jgi:mannosyltransferase
VADDPMSAAPVSLVAASSPAWVERGWRLAPAAVGAFAFVLGLVSLTGQRRSYDERITIETASRSITGIWRSARTTEAPHVVYYLLMKPWLAAFGSSDWVARFPSVVVGALAASVLTALGIRLFGRTAGLVAGVTLATAAYVMHFSQWARGYSLALLLTVLASYAFVRAHDEPRGRWVALWGVALVAACWVNLFAISVLAAYVAAYLVMRPHPRPRLAVAAFIGVCAALTPIILLVATADNGQLDWIPMPTIRRVAVQTWDWSSRNPFALVAAAVAIGSFFIGARRRVARWKATLVIGWTIAPFLLTLALSAVQPAFDSHYLLTAAAGLALLVGAGVAALPHRASLLLVALVAVAAGLQLAHYYIAPGRPLTSLL